MVGKKSGKALLKEEGLERTDNNMELSSWPQVAPINQKNYYTDYLKRDDQMLAYRLQNEENRARIAKKAKDRERVSAMKNELPLPETTSEAAADAAADDADEVPPDAKGSRTVVIHLGSQNLRIGLASDALPKTMPMVIAHKAEENEAEERGGEPRPKRLKVDGSLRVQPEKLFGDEFASEYSGLQTHLKQQMRLNKRRTLPNSKEMVINYNRRTPFETIPEHNDPLRIEYTDVAIRDAPEHIIGEAALKIPDYSTPRYKLHWPIRHGWPNERDYPSKLMLFQDFGHIIEYAIKTQLGLARKKDWGLYSCVFVIPDLYEKTYVTELLDMLLREFSFARVCFVQEGLAGSFGAGFTTACVVDIGAQKTSVCCVDEGMCVENSRINVKIGGGDVTEMFMKMMLFDCFPYAEINLNRRYDWLLAEDLKKKHCTLNEANVSVQLFDFHLRAHGQDTRKYTFKAYDEVYLAPFCLFQPHLFDHGDKLLGRRRLVPRSYDLYDNQPNDPTSAAQTEVLNANAPAHLERDDLAALHVQSTPTKAASQSFLPFNRRHDLDATPRSSVANSPVRDGSTRSPQPTGTHTGAATPFPDSAAAQKPTTTPVAAAARPWLNDRDDILPVAPLDAAIFTSITHAAKPEDRKFTDFLGGILVLGGGSLVPNLHSALEDRLRVYHPQWVNSIMVGTPPRELDPQVVVWKGASVFGKLDAANDSWISRLEYDRLGSRILVYKCMWAW